VYIFYNIYIDITKLLNDIYEIDNCNCHKVLWNFKEFFYAWDKVKRTVSNVTIIQTPKMYFAFLVTLWIDIRVFLATRGFTSWLRISQKKIGGSRRILGLRCSIAGSSTKIRTIYSKSRNVCEWETFQWIYWFHFLSFGPYSFDSLSQVLFVRELTTPCRHSVDYATLGIPILFCLFLAVLLVTAVHLSW